MLVKQLDNTDNTRPEFSISYIDKNEAMFILGLLKPMPCTHCPDFHKGCSGGSTLQENAMMSERDFIDRHIHGTEEFLCGKLRNIVALSRAEEQDMSNKFEMSFNKRVSMLTKKNDDEEHYVLIHDKDEFNKIVKTIERQMIEKLQHDVEKINRHNANVVSEMQEKIEYQSKMIQDMQKTIRKLKKSSEDVA
jgi:hypothetical protein